MPKVTALQKLLFVRLELSCRLLQRNPVSAVQEFGTPSVTPRTFMEYRMETMTTTMMMDHP